MVGNVVGGGDRTFMSVYYSHHFVEGENESVKKTGKIILKS